MRTALLLVPETNKSIDRQKYISACLIQVINEGFNPLTPAVYEKYTTINIHEFITDAITKPDLDTVFLFIDFGIDKMMFDVIDRCSTQAIKMVYCKINTVDSNEFLTFEYKILSDVSGRMSLTMQDLQRRTRDRKIVDARYIFFYRCRKLTNLSLSAIGNIVGLDHASVLHGLTQVGHVRELKDLYDKCYGKAEVKTAILDPQEGEAISDAGPIPGPILPYYQMEAREPEVQGAQPSLCPVSKGWAGCPFSGYRPHNT